MSLVHKPLTYAVCKKLANKRIKEASVLLRKREYGGAYYLAGYAIELGLKACYCKNVPRYIFPPDKKTYNNLYTHDFNKILQSSGIKAQFDVEVNKNTDLNTA